MENYNLDTGKKYIKDIFAPDCFYNIPEYQRPYVWGKEQIHILLDDLHAAIENDDKKEYFLGCMIWNTKKAKSNDLEYVSQDILDGQQRFITLYILHSVIRDLSKDEKLKTKVDERMRQESDIYDGVPERSRIEFEIRDDKEFIEKYLIDRGGTLDRENLEKIITSKEKSKSIKNMAEAIFSMQNWWGKIEAEIGEEGYQEYLKKFFVYLGSKVLAIYLATPDNLDDAYNLFTVLNSRGLQLQVSDILRAQNLRIIANGQERKRYAEKWSTFEDNIGSPFKGFDDFLWTLVFIRMKYRSDDNQSLKKAFDFMWRRNMLKKGISTFEFVGKYVAHYEEITNESITERDTGLLFSNLNFILTSVFGSLYMAPLLHYKECFGTYRITEFLVKLDNLLSLAWLTGKRSSQTRVFILLRKMEEIKGQKFDNAAIREAADSFLASDYLRYDYDDEKATTKYELEELFQLFDSEQWGAYSGTRINKTRYILLKLDLIYGNFRTRLQFNRLNASVEHLMPRKIEGTEWDVDEYEHQNWVHRLGNLALIDRRKNSSLSNRTYPEKRIRYQGSIETRANTNHIFMNYPNWNIQTIQSNHERIKHILQRYYSGNSIQTLLELKAQLQTDSVTLKQLPLQ